MPCQDCIDLNIPQHLCSDGRESPIKIEDHELLYRRFEKKVPDGVTPKNLDLEYQKAFFKFNNDSYNRSGYSAPEDVLIDSKGIKYPTNGIFSVKSSLLPIEKTYDTNNGTSKCKIEFHHKSEDCNYSHCELHCFVDGAKKDKNAPPPSLKLIFRRLLIENIDIIKNVD